MGNRPAGCTLDRINNDGNYEPSNCRWATALEQGKSMEKTILVTYQGETMSATQWAKRIGIGAATFRYRLRKWPLEIAMTRPVGRWLQP
jgi:hypothetical protein